MATIEDPQQKPQPLSKRVMHLTTAAILFGNIAFGCSTTAFAPALGSIAWRYKTTIADISIVFTLVLILYCIGAIICGLLSKHINRQLVVIISLIAMASSMILTPYCPTKMMFFVCGGVFGLSSGFYHSSEVVWIIEIWQQRAGPFIQSQHFCFAIGTIIPPAVLAPFLNKDNYSQTSTVDSEQSTIHIPFLIIGTMDALALLFQLFLFLFYRYHTPPMYAEENVEPSKADLSENISTKQKELESDNVKSKISNRKIQLVAFSVLFLSAYQAMEISTMNFLPIFGQYSDIKLSESAAADVLTGFMAMYAAGRLLGIFITFKLRPEVIIAVNLVLIATGNTILSVWAGSSVTMFWIGSMILGIGFSTMFPSFFTFIEKHLIVSGLFASCTMVIGTTTSAMYPIFFGKVIEHQAVVLTYTNFASTFVCITFMIWGYTMTRKTMARE